MTGLANLNVNKNMIHNSYHTRVYVETMGLEMYYDKADKLTASRL